MHESLIFGIGLSIITAVVLAFGGKLTRQPFILAYLIAGVVIGPHLGFGLVKDKHSIQTISELGLIFLLYMIGLEIDLKKVKTSGKLMVVTGIVQLVVSMVLLLIGLVICLPSLSSRLGAMDVIYLAFALSLSSTVIIVKLLYDKFELETLPGRVTLGVLILQDIWAILFLGVQANLVNPQIFNLVKSFIGIIILTGGSLLVSRYLLPPLYHWIARVPELVLTTSMAWCFAVAEVSNLMGISRAMGALIAGISISTFPYNLDVIAKLISFRDFFLILFFVTLGMDIEIPSSETITVVLVCLPLVLLSRLISVYPVLRLMRTGNRVGIITSLNLTPISEFGIVIGAIGLAAGHISATTMSIIIFIFALTSVIGTYFISYNFSIYQSLNRFFSRLGLKETVLPDEKTNTDHRTEIVLLGFSRVASSLLYEIEKDAPELKPKLLVVDFNPEVYLKLKEKDIPCIYGDISNVDTLKHAGINSARIIISTIPDLLLKGTDNLRLVSVVRALSAPETRIIATTESLLEVQSLYDAGADYVFLPRLLSATHLYDVVKNPGNYFNPLAKEKAVKTRTQQADVEVINH